MSVSKSAVRQIIEHCVSEYNKDYIVYDLKIKKNKGSYSFKLFLDIPLGNNLLDNAEMLRNYIIANVLKYTVINMSTIDVIIHKFYDNKGDLEEKKMNLDLDNLSRFFLVGIKGSGLCSLACFLKSKGCLVEGVDIPFKFYTDELLDNNHIIYYENIYEFSLKKHDKLYDILIYSPAYNKDQLCFTRGL